MHFATEVSKLQWARWRSSSCFTNCLTFKVACLCTFAIQYNMFCERFPELEQHAGYASVFFSAFLFGYKAELLPRSRINPKQKYLRLKLWMCQLCWMGFFSLRYRALSPEPEGVQASQTQAQRSTVLHCRDSYEEAECHVRSVPEQCMLFQPPFFRWSRLFHSWKHCQEISTQRDVFQVCSLLEFIYCYSWSAFLCSCSSVNTFIVELLKVFHTSRRSLRSYDSFPNTNIPAP